MPGMPGCGKAPHINSGDGNFERYQTNLKNLFNKDGTMKGSKEFDKERRARPVLEKEDLAN